MAIRAVNDNQFAYDGVDTSLLQSNIPVKDTAVILIDGDIPQLNAMKKAIDVYDENRITYCKLNPASSHLEAACDKEHGVQNTEGQSTSTHGA